MSITPTRSTIQESLSLFLCAGTLVALIVQVALFWSGAAMDGLGWALSVVGWVFVHFAPLMLLVGVAVSLIGSPLTSRRWFALGCAAAAIPLDAWIWLSSAFTPRNPLG